MGLRGTCQPGLPQAVDGPLSRALAKAPGDRYASCGQFADALRDAFGIQPYDSRPRVILAAAHPPTEIARPATQGAGPYGGQATEAAAAPGPAPGAGEPPATATSIPAALNAFTGPGQFPAGGGSDTAQPPRRPRRRIVVAASIAVIILAAAGLTAGLLTGSTGSHKSTAVPISLKSALPALSGDVYVVYRGGKQASAEIYGEINKAANGEVAQSSSAPS